MTSTRVAPTVDERLANAAKALAEQSMPATQIAAVLGLDEAAVALILGGAAEANRGRRVLGSELQKQLDNLMEEDSDLCCPVSLMLFVDPVVGSDGFLYEKASYKGLLQNRMVSPMTRERLKTDFLPARQRKSAAMDFRETRSVELLKFAEDVLASEPNMAKEALQRVSEYLEVSTPAKETHFDESHRRPLPEGKKYHYFMSHKKHHSKLGNTEAIAMQLHDSLEAKGYCGFFRCRQLRGDIQTRA